MNEQDPFLAYDYNFKKKGMDEGDSGDVFLWSFYLFYIINQLNGRKTHKSSKKSYGMDKFL